MLKGIGLPTEDQRHWSDPELSAALEAYLHALQLSLAGKPVKPASVIANLHEGALQNRTLHSLELRMRNISSVLYDLKLPYLPQWRPARNVGSRVKARIVGLIPKTDIFKLEIYSETTERDLLEKRVSLLRKQKEIALPNGSLQPDWEMKNIKFFYRNPAIKAWILENAKGICEGCDSPAHFRGSDGLPYLEVHHVLPLSQGGSDRTENTVALCSNCHTRCHYSIDRDEFKLYLYQKVIRLRVPDPIFD
jgi:5-methylcytosine-specific restriction protein A